MLKPQGKNNGAMVGVGSFQMFNMCFWVKEIPININEHPINSLLDELS